MDTDDRVRVRVGPQGRVVIPAALREKMGLGVGEELVARLEDGRIVLERREDVIRRLKAGFANVPKSRVLSEELIAERREEAKAEEDDVAGFGGRGLRDDFGG